MRLYQVLSADEAGSIVERIRGMEWAQGRASSPLATGTVKKNRELKATDGEPAESILKDLHKRLEALQDEHFIRLMLVPRFNRYGVGEAYHEHADAAWMGRRIRTDLACTIFLTDDYDGGELCVNGVSLKGEPGTCVVYECWRPHHVNPVTRGERICAITWMQSGIRDETQREVLNLFQSVLKDVDRTSDEERLYPRLSALYGKLVRIWLEN
jgi:PKHD-type hydroxylase